ncbi:MAG: TetR/AcrR family transcriptional regulator [Eubacterium sp.]|nr:TetR/AcrR family transcriptional regulator [Eubacterium sp.]
MARTNAKEPLVEAARNLFSIKGYDGTSVDEIAEAVGVKGPTIYKYFKNKEDLLKAVIDCAEDEYMRGMEVARDIPDRIHTGEDFKGYVLASLNFTLNNETAKKMRRLTTIEQFRNEALSKQTTRHQLTYLKDLYTYIFQKMMDRGAMIEGDASIYALQFISPITIMIQYMEREPDKKEDAFKMIDKHIDAFIDLYFK